MDFFLSPVTIVVVVFMVVAWQVLLTFLVWKQTSTFQKLAKNAKGQDLQQILSTLLNTLNISDQKLERSIKRLEIMEEKAPLFLQKVGFIRFNPYNEVGSDQSFSLALLDEKGNGLVITSLHARSMTRIYAKTVSSSVKDQHPLSKEEVEAVKMALKK